MGQPVKNEIKKVHKIKKVKKNISQAKKKHKEYGTSKLEEKFAKEFLEKLGINYVYQYKAESIGRYFDFRIMPNGPIFEIQGGYWHADPRLYEEKELNPTQKKNKRVDEHKRKWALANGIPIYYFWEKDINENPEKVLNEICDILYIENKKNELKENKKKRQNPK